MVVGLATVYTSCMPCGFLPILIHLCALIKKKKMVKILFQDASQVKKLTLIRAQDLQIILQGKGSLEALEKEP